MDNQLSWYVPKTPWNEINSPDLIGRFFPLHSQPSYTRVKPSTLPCMGYEIVQLDMITVQAIARLESVINGIRKIYYKD